MRTRLLSLAGVAVACAAMTAATAQATSPGVSGERSRAVAQQAAEATPKPLPAAMTLPSPVTSGGKPLMDVLRVRQSSREYAPDRLSQQTLSNLLWAAWGVNRPDGRRTAPSASNRQEIDIYVTLPEGAFRWDAKANRLEPVSGDDLRAATGTQPFPASAPLNLVYVASFDRLNRPATDPQQLLNVGADAGFISQNVYLFCASEGLATVVRALVPKEALAKALKLADTQTIVLAQTVGYQKR